MQVWARVLDFTSKAMLVLAGFMLFFRRWIAVASGYVVGAGLVAVAGMASSLGLIAENPAGGLTNAIATFTGSLAVALAAICALIVLRRRKLLQLTIRSVIPWTAAGAALELLALAGVALPWQRETSS